MGPAAQVLQQRSSLNETRDVTTAPGTGLVEESDITRFYRGRSVLVTGASGFMGKVLVEKLLRSFPDLGDVFVLVRTKKGREAQDRLRDILKTPAFDTLRRRTPHALTKVKAVPGDVSLPGLGLSAADRALLENNVSVVFHVAATVRFNEHLRRAAEVNVAGTRAVLDLCRNIVGLVALLHVSTAYSAADRRMVQELVYSAPMSAMELEEELLSRDDAAVARDTPRLIGAHPNTYTFTKAIAETVILEEGNGLPVAVVRPSIVGPSWREPVPGWIDNWNGPVGPLVAIGVGTLSCVFGRPNVVADLVPVDICINKMVAAAWDVHAHRNANGAGVTVYNCVSGPSNPVTWGDVMALWTTRVRRKPYASSLGTVKASFTINRTVYNLRSLTGQLIPAHAIDALAKVTNRKSPGLAQIIRKQFAKMETLDFFLTREFAFAVDNSKALWGRMAPADRLLFPYADIAAMDWGKYLEVVLEGSKTYLLRENPTRQEAKFCCRSRMEESPNEFRIDRLLPLLAMPMLAVTAGPAMCIENLQYHWTRVCGQSGESLFRVERVLPLLALPVILVTAGPLLCLDMIQSHWSDIEALIVAAKQFLWDRKYNLACFIGFILGLVKFFL